MGLFSGIADLATSLIGGSASGALGALGGIGDYYSASNLQKKSRDDILAANAANFAEAEKNRQFQDKQAMDSRTFAQNVLTSQQNFSQNMSNTAYQRAVGDLRQAGLNPMLATGHPASTPSGGSAGAIPIGSGATARAIPAVAQAATAAAQVKSLNAEADTKHALSRELNSRALLNAANADNARQSARTGVSSAAHLDTQAEVARRNLPYDLELKAQEKRKKYEETLSEPEKRRHTRAQTDETRQRTKNLGIEATLRGLDVTRAKNEERAQHSAFMRNVAPYFKFMQGGASSAASAAAARAMLMR